MRGRRFGRVALVGAVLLLAAGGCDTTVQEQLGIGTRQPDEFQVVRRAPLVIPPDATPPPPRPGATAAAQPDPAAEPRGLLTGEDAAAEPRTAGGSLRPGEQALLAQSPIRADPGIRNKIVAENAELARLDRRLFLYILNFQRAQFEPKDRVLDPAAEAARLRGAGAAGRPGGVVTTTRTGSVPLPPSR